MNGQAEVTRVTREVLVRHVSSLSATLRLDSLDRVAAAVLSSGEDRSDDPAALVIALVHAAHTSSVKLSRTATGSVPLVQHDRHTARRADLLDETLVALEAALGIAAKLPSPTRRAGQLDTSAVLDTLLLLSQPEHSPLLREASLSLIRVLLRRHPEHERVMILGLRRLETLRTMSLPERSRKWVRCAALKAIASCKTVAVIEHLKGQACPNGALRDAMQGDDALCRAVAIQELLKLSPDESWVKQARLDPSEYVRQSVCKALAQAETLMAVQQLTEIQSSDTSPRVRAVALLGLARCAGLGLPEALASFAKGINTTETADAQSDQALGHRARLSAIQAVMATQHIGSICPEVASSLQTLIQVSQLDTAEQAALTLRRLELNDHVKLLRLNARLASLPVSIAEGKTRRLNLDAAEREGLEYALWGGLEGAVERAALVAAADDIPWFLRLNSQHLEVFRGERRRLRLWRLLFELRNLAPDKRQGFPHSHARVSAGPIALCPPLLGEVTPTGVPGERITIEGSCWGSFLPRAEELLFACEQYPVPRRLVTPFGTLAISVPTRWLSRKRLQAWLTLRLAQLERLRLHCLFSTNREQQGAYSRRLDILGIRLSWDNTNVVVLERMYSLKPARLEGFYPNTGTLQ